MAYPQIVEYHEAVQHPAQAFTDPELKQGAVAENNLGLPLVMSGGFALTYAVTTPRRKCAVRCFHREIPAIQQKYDAISKKLRSLSNGCFVYFDFQQSASRPFRSSEWTGSKVTRWASGWTSTSTIRTPSKRHGPILPPSPVFSSRRELLTATFRTAT